MTIVFNIVLVIAIVVLINILFKANTRSAVELKPKFTKKVPKFMFEKLVETYPIFKKATVTKLNSINASLYIRIDLKGLGISTIEKIVDFLFTNMFDGEISYKLTNKDKLELVTRFHDLSCMDSDKRLARYSFITDSCVASAKLSLVIEPLRLLRILDGTDKDWVTTRKYKFLRFGASTKAGV